MGNDVKIDDLTQTVSDRSGVEPQAVKKILESAFAVLGEELAKEDKLELQGLGTFIRRQNRKPGARGRTLFKSWSVKSARIKKRKAGNAKKKAKRKTRKTEKGSSP
jgi:nucleoid DNA-binding protein